MMVADSDVLIDFLEGRAPAANRVALEVDRGQLRTTAEVKTARQLKLVGGLLAALPVFRSTSREPMRRPRSVEPWNGTACGLAWVTASSPGSWRPITASS